MEFKTTDRTKSRRSAFTLIEVIVALAVSTIVMLTLLTFAAFSGRSFASMVNYWDLDRKSKGALDQMSRDIRRCESLASSSTTKLVFWDRDGTPLTYVYNPSAKTLSRVKGTTTNVFLTECDYLTFGTYQRTPIGGTYEQFAVSNAFTCKLVQLNWTCSRKVLGSKLNTESVQSAKIVMRKR